tara:strand:- start:241 stop:435 length:195 start_codon:yes stop_codon:yes gene_type:complete
MQTNYTKDIYNRIMKMQAPKETTPEPKGLLTRISKKDNTTVTDIDLVRSYVDAIQSERGGLADG